MKYIIPVIILIFIFYKFLKAYYEFNQMKKRLNYNLMKIENELTLNPNNPLVYCRRATIYQILQNFVKAKTDYTKALQLIDLGYKAMNEDKEIQINEKFITNIHQNIGYVNKPLPWSKNGPKDLSNSWLTFFLIERLGNTRTNF